MNQIKRAELLAGAVQDWLDDRTGELKQAAERTIADKLFPEHDILFALDVIRETVTADSLKKWISKTGLKQKPGSPQNVLCLHAGNLPLVGFQDVMSVLLAGHNYYGKLSRKDPWLLDSLLRRLSRTEAFKNIQWSVNLDELSPGKAGAVLFSGSDKSVAPVLTELNKRNWLDEYTKKIIRTAHASAAWFDISGDGLDDLAEAVFRYEGKGCRSVAAIFTPGNSESLLNDLAEAANQFLDKNPSAQKTLPALDFRHAYNRAVGKTSVRKGNILLETGDPDLKKDGVVTISGSDVDDVRTFVSRSGPVLQTVYSNMADMDEFEPLNAAQKPEIYWKPDGIDPLRALADI